MITDTTVVVTTVHEVQVVATDRIPVTDHDFLLDLIVTPDRVIDCRMGRRHKRRLGGICWDELTDDKIASIPLLRTLHARRRSA